MSGVSRMPSNESVIPTVSVSAITKLNGKIGVVGIYLILFCYSPCIVQFIYILCLSGYIMLSFYLFIWFFVHFVYV